MSFTVKGMDKLIKDLRRLDKEMDEQVVKWLEALGWEFLAEIQNQIIEMQVVDTRRLLNSFDKGSPDLFWEFQKDKLVLELGTNVEYARLVNDGHWTRAKASWVNGRPYFDLAFEIFKRLFEKSLERKLTEWMKRR